MCIKYTMTAFFMEEEIDINNGYPYIKNCIVTPYKNKKRDSYTRRPSFSFFIKKSYSTFNK